MRGYPIPTKVSYEVLREEEDKKRQVVFDHRRSSKPSRIRYDEGVTKCSAVQCSAEILLTLIQLL